MTVAICHCPTCGAPYAGGVPRVDLGRNTFICSSGAVVLQAQVAEIAAMLADAFPRVLHTERIIARLYGAGDMPDDAANVVRVRIHELRRKLRPLGWGVATYHRRGYALVREPEVTE